MRRSVVGDFITVLLQISELIADTFGLSERKRVAAFFGQYDKKSLWSANQDFVC